MTDKRWIDMLKSNLRSHEDIPLREVRTANPAVRCTPTSTRTSFLVLSAGHRMSWTARRGAILSPQSTDVLFEKAKKPHSAALFLLPYYFII